MVYNHDGTPATSLNPPDWLIDLLMPEVMEQLKKDLESGRFAPVQNSEFGQEASPHV